MAEQFYTILTRAGKAKIANATALGVKVNLTKFQVGDGGGSYYNPSEDQTQLRNKVWEGNISSISVDNTTPNWIVLEVIIPSDIGGFMIREVGVFDDGGNLIAIGKYPETYKPAVQNGSTKDLYIRMILEVSNTSSVTLKVDPTVILATKKDIQILSNDLTNFKQEVNTQLADIANKGKVGTKEVDEANIKDNYTLRYDANKDKIVYVEDKIDRIPPAPVTNIRVKEDNKKVIITYTIPSDNDYMGTRLVYKTGSYPTGLNDGTVIGNYISGTEITGLTNDITYYFRLFPYDTSNNYNTDTSQQITATPTEQKIYGVVIDESNSNPKTSVTYTDDAVGFTPARGGNGNFSWGSWESIIKEEFEIRPVVLKNLGNKDAVVNYELQYDDFTKKEDGTTANLTGADGDVMIEFGVPLWWKFSRVGSKLKIQLSNKQFDGAVKHAFEIEKGYNQVPIYPLFLTQIIYLLMFKNLDSQTALGKGRTDATSYTNTGTTNKKTFCYGSTDTTDNVKFLGMEDYFGNRRWWIDGCYYDNNRNILIGKSNFNDTGSGYENFGQAASSNLGGHIDKVQGGNNTGFIPASTSGSTTTYYCDYGDVCAGGLPGFGGYRSTASDAGAFCLASNAASASDAGFGSRLFCSRNGKIYIGAYLGVEQNGKLRSISGKESANNKTIGSFRNLARVNN